jgi:phosphoglycolate phosphatase
MIELVMFDADGVLFDSDQSNVAYYNAIFTQIGEAPLDAVEEINAISHAAGQVFSDRARDNHDKLARMHQIARDLDPAPFFHLLKPPFELRPFMLELKNRYRLALATNRSATVPALVEHLKLAGIFDAIASARDQVRPKPAPDILKLCLERARVAREHAIYVGDSVVDREAAEGAGVGFVAVGRRVEHSTQIAHLAELPATLARIAATR